jgi:hypothetical protein
MAEFTFGLFAGAFVALLVANITIIVARLSHHDEIAQKVIRIFAPVAWLLRLGADSEGRHRRSENGHPWVRHP